MAFEENGGGSNMYMPVAPAYGGNGFGGFGGDGWWIILLLLCGWGGMGMGGMGGWGGMNGLYPWLNQSNQINDGFRDQMLNTTVTGIQGAVNTGFGDVQTALCGGFAGVNASINGAQNALAQQMYTNQIADLERSYAAQTANTQGLTNIGQQLASCCCENRLATANLTADLAREACATRTANADNTQKILDKLCQLELDNYKTQLASAQRDNAALQNQVILATERADRTAQTGAIIDGVYGRLATCPVDTTPVYGRQMIFQCPQQVNPNNGCGCNNNSGFVA